MILNRNTILHHQQFIVGKLRYIIDFRGGKWPIFVVDKLLKQLHLNMVMLIKSLYLSVIFSGTNNSANVTYLDKKILYSLKLQRHAIKVFYRSLGFPKLPSGLVEYYT